MVGLLTDDEYSRRPRVMRRQAPYLETQAPLENQLKTLFAMIVESLKYREKTEVK
jgi:hypothetical protein